MEWLVLYLLPAAIGFGGGFLYGRRTKQDRERRKLLALEAEEKKKEEDAFEASILKAKRQALAESTRAALDFGYTMQQVLDWAYNEAYFEDFKPAARRGRNVSNHPYNTPVWQYTETQDEANWRQRQERYDFLKKVLLGYEDHAALEGRNILEALRIAGVESQAQKVATLIRQAAEEVEEED